MKQIITYLVVTVLGLLSPSLSSLAQNFSGVFKEITSQAEFTEGYYVIVQPHTGDPQQALCGVEVKGKGKNRKHLGTKEAIVIEPNGEIHSPKNSSVWKVQQSDGMFTIQNKESGKYLSATNNNELHVADETSKDTQFAVNEYAKDYTNPRGKAYSFYHYSKKVWLVYGEHIKDHAFVFTESGKSGHKLKTAAPRFFKLVEQENIPFTISAAKYATYYGEKAVKLPTGLKAYIGKVEASKHIVQLTAISDVVPAKTAVIITGEAGTHSLTVTTEAGTTITDNNLMGSLVEIPFENFETSKDYYALAQSPENKVCFGLLKTDLPAGKAYFTLPKAAGSAPQFLGEFLVSSVKQVQRNTTEGAIYDLNGKKVTHPVSGNVYVRNGKKFIFLR